MHAGLRRVERKVGFRPGFKIGAAANVGRVHENLRYGFDGFADGLFQIRFGDAFRVNINITEVEISAVSFSASSLARTQ